MEEAFPSFLVLPAADDYVVAVPSTSSFLHAIYSVAGAGAAPIAAAVKAARDPVAPSAETSAPAAVAAAILPSVVFFSAFALRVVLSVAAFLSHAAAVAAPLSVGDATADWGPQPESAAASAAAGSEKSASPAAISAKGMEKKVKSRLEVCCSILSRPLFLLLQ